MFLTPGDRGGADAGVTRISLDNAIIRFNGPVGRQIQSSGILIDDNGNIYPAVNDGGALGLSGNSFSDLFLASGAIINFGSGNVTLTHSTGVLTMAGTLTLGTPLAIGSGGTGLTTYTQGDILYSDATNSLAKLAKNTTASRYLSNSGTSNNPAWAQVDLTNGVTGNLPIGNGGTGQALTDPNIDRIMMWDDSAGAVKFAALADLNTETAPVSGDFILIYDAAGNLLKTDWVKVISANSSSTDNQLIRWDGTTGALIQGSTAVLSDDGNLNNNVSGSQQNAFSTTSTVGRVYFKATCVTDTLGDLAGIALARQRTTGTFPQSGDFLAEISVNTNVSPFGGGLLSWSAAENHDATHAGTNCTYVLTPTGSSAQKTRIKMLGDGPIGIGEQLNPVRRLHVTEDGSATNTVNNLLRLTNTSTGTPAAGLGCGMEWELETAASVNKVGGVFQAVMESGTTSAERIVMQVRQMAGGALQDPEGITFFHRSLTADTAYSNINTVQSWFPSTGTITLKASTTYEFEGLLMMTNGTTSHTLALGFGGTATLTSIGYTAFVGTAAVNATAAVFASAMMNAATSTVVSAAITVAGTQVWVRGLVRINAAGTFIPQFTFSAAPGAGNVLKNSFFKMREVGTDTNTTQGAWT